MSRQYDAGLVDGLLERFSREKDGVRLREYADCLARVHKKPGPWVYWDYRPEPRPANQVAWERTEAIAVALNRMLSHSDPELRLAVLKQMRREQVPASLEAMGQWLKEESDPGRVAALLDFLRDQPAADVQQYLEPVIRNPLQSSTNRLTALALFVRGIGKEHADSLLALSEGLEDGPVLAEALRSVGKYPQLAAAPLLDQQAGFGQAGGPRRRHRDAGRAAGGGGTGAARRGCLRIRIPKSAAPPPARPENCRSGARSSHC